MKGTAMFGWLHMLRKQQEAKARRIILDHLCKEPAGSLNTKRVEHLLHTDCAGVEEWASNDTKVRILLNNHCVRLAQTEFPSKRSHTLSILKGPMRHLTRASR